MRIGPKCPTCSTRQPVLDVLRAEFFWRDFKCPGCGAVLEEKSNSKLLRALTCYFPAASLIVFTDYFEGLGVSIAAAVVIAYSISIITTPLARLSRVEQETE